ncbi:mRNA-decapping enzyme subunit 2 [Lambiella insularis]|nr:mRNA-decapping enzyme subunit 2 [Lambiella insularis]
MTEIKMQLVDWLDDLCVRFIVNLPKEELESVERICFQVEEAQWFYEDFVRPLDPNLPTLNLRQFCLRIFQHCPLLSGFSPYHHSTAFSEFLAYKTRVPVRGAIMLNETMDEVVLVKGWKKNANWSFPRGKINKDEKDLDCAIREVYEETGFDISAAGLVPSEEDVKYIEVTMREQHMRLYVFRGVPMDTHFKPRTRKEISKIQWYKLSELPTLKKMRQQQQDGQGGDLAVNANKFYMVAPFLTPLKKWISMQRKLDAMNRTGQSKDSSAAEYLKLQGEDNMISDMAFEPPSTDDMHRLMTQLRQSQQTASPNPIELSAPTEPIPDASMQLKSFLNVPSIAAGRPQNYDKPFLSRDEKATAMLSLLRSGLSDDPKIASKSAQLPQTPLEQIVGLSKTPRSPQNEFVRASQMPNLASPPAFPFSPGHAGMSDILEQNVSGAQRPSFPATASHSTAHEGGKKLILPCPTHSFATQNHFHKVLAPYQRTGDPQFAHGAQISQKLPPSIPPADALPPPKLTSHSSALLDLFKTGTIVKSSIPEIPTQSSSTFHDSKAQTDELVPPMQPSLVAKAALQSGVELTPSANLAGQSTFIPIYSTLPGKSSDYRSQQQKALLDLFRTPATFTVSKAHTSGPSLAPPTTIVELSAQQSPNHSRDHSAVTNDDPEPLPSNAHVKIQKRPKGVREASQGPLSATVTGPLNFPQFDRISSLSEERVSSAQGSGIEIPSHGVRPQAHPMTILSRPSVNVIPTPASTVSKIENCSSSSQDKTRSKYHLRERSNELDHAAKTFHPQILRRRAEIPSSHHVSPILHPIPSPISPINPAAAEVPSPPQPSPLITKDNLLLDRRGSQTLEQKTALLSLFSKSSTMLPPPTPTGIAAISSISERPVRLDNTVPSPLNIQQSTIASWNSIAGEGNGKVVVGGTSDRMISKPSPVDKKFLLGFLDEVVKEGSK